MTCTYVAIVYKTSANISVHFDEIAIFGREIMDSCLLKEKINYNTGKESSAKAVLIKDLPQNIQQPYNHGGNPHIRKQAYDFDLSR